MTRGGSLVLRILIAIIGFAMLGAALADHGGFQLRRLTHQQALQMLQDEGMGISSSGNCSDQTQSNCTSLEGIYEHVINEVILLKGASGCTPSRIVVTGGTEAGHAQRTYSHANGYKIDLRKYDCIDNFIRSKDAITSDGAAFPAYQWGNAVYIDEGNHWDVLKH